MRIQAFLAAAMLIGTAAAQSPTPAAPDANAKPEASAAAASTTAPATSACDKSAAKDAKKVAKGEIDPCTADLGDLQKAGYVIKKQNGETLYCRKDKETGSRVKSNTFCLTRDQLMQMQANTRDG